MPKRLKGCRQNKLNQNYYEYEKINVFFSCNGLLAIFVWAET